MNNQDNPVQPGFMVTPVSQANGVICDVAEVDGAELHPYRIPLVNHIVVPHPRFIHITAIHKKLGKFGNRIGKHLAFKYAYFKNGKLVCDMDELLNVLANEFH